MLTAVSVRRGPMQRIPDWSALGPAARQRRREAARPLARALDELLNAFAWIDPQPPRAGPGPLAGLPYAAKDMFATPSRRPTGGFEDARELGIEGESDLIARLAAAGGDLIGFANMTELAYEPSGFSASRGRVKNPWNTDFIAGGSSSGSAAAVAGGAVVVALGSDTGGSLRIPAHACGITAWKPTHGFVSSAGAMALAPTLDSIGLLARSADDMMPMARASGDLPDSEPIRRVALLGDVTDACDPCAQRAVAAVADALAGLGMAIERRDGLAAIAESDRHALVVMQGEAARAHRPRLDDAAIDPVLRKRLAKGLEIADAPLAASVAARPSLATGFVAGVLSGCDAALFPVMPIPTPRADECDPASPRFSGRTLYALSRFTRFVNMLGFPAVALPAGFDGNGMPVGVQIVGRPGADLALLDLVRHVQGITDWHGRAPNGTTHLLTEAELSR
jgi:Asp-tRNA(Asn)/Glu-tRNA(Gln) amidotransferase A subunit family amidase